MWEYYKLLLLILGLFGNGWFWTSYVNRLYSIPWPSPILNRWRKVGELAVIAIPVGLAYTLFAGGTPGVSFASGTVGTTGLTLAVGTLTSWPWWYWGVWSFPAVGWLAFGLTHWHRWTAHRPPGFCQTDSQIIDMEARLGYKPLGSGPHLRLLHVPGNQALTLELNTKRFEFDRLPAPFAGLRVLHLSDLHFSGEISREYFEQAFTEAARTRPDLVLFTGDLFDNPALTDWLPSTLGQLQPSLGCYFILGNHDWHLEESEIRRSLQELGWQDCQGQVHEIVREGARLQLGGDERPWMGAAAEFPAETSEAFRILLSHTPDNINWARGAGVDLMLSGHNHGGQVKLPGIGPLLAPSRYGVRFADGIFQLDPTTLHVSRGLSGRHPLRIQCRPEISLLILENSTDLHTPG